MPKKGEEGKELHDGSTVSFSNDVAARLTRAWHEKAATTNAASTTMRVLLALHLFI
jgi:hypothetical protein